MISTNPSAHLVTGNTTSVSYTLQGLFAAACLTIGLGTQAWAAPIISPFAADLPASSYSASNTWPGTSAQNAFNGGYWNGGGYGPHWIQADMLSTQTLSMVQVQYAGSHNAPNQSNVYIRVYLSDDPIGNLWTSLTPVAIAWGPFVPVNHGQPPSVLTFTPTSGRYLQMVAHYGHFSWVALGDYQGRQNWTDPTSMPPPPTSSVPEPGSGLLLLAGLGALGFAKRYRSPDGRVRFANV